jgi:hypothetical protein
LNAERAAEANEGAKRKAHFAGVDRFMAQFDKPSKEGARKTMNARQDLTSMLGSLRGDHMGPVDCGFRTKATFGMR